MVGTESESQAQGAAQRLFSSSLLYSPRIFLVLIFNLTFSKLTVFLDRIINFLIRSEPPGGARPAGRRAADAVRSSGPIGPARRRRRRESAAAGAAAARRAAGRGRPRTATVRSRCQVASCTGTELSFDVTGPAPRPFTVRALTYRTVPYGRPRGASEYGQSGSPLGRCPTQEAGGPAPGLRDSDSPGSVRYRVGPGPAGPVAVTGPLRLAAVCGRGCGGVVVSSGRTGSTRSKAARRARRETEERRNHKPPVFVLLDQLL